VLSCPYGTCMTTWEKAAVASRGAGGQRRLDVGQWSLALLPPLAVAHSNGERTLQFVGRFAVESENLRCITARDRRQAPLSACSLAPSAGAPPYLSSHSPRPSSETRQHTDLLHSETLC
jgi:hypothetical protein